MPSSPSQPRPVFFNPSRIVAGLWKNRDLAWQFTLRNIEVRHKGSYLGFFWSLLTPLLTFGLYMLVFGFIFRGRFGVVPHETRSEFALALFIGISIVQLVVEVIATSPMMIVAQPNFVKKVVFPLEILPVAGVGASVFHFFIALAIAVLGVALAGGGLSWSACLIPVIMLPVVLLAFGLGWMIAALGVFLRDIGQAAQFFGQVLMYASAVMYSVRIIPHAVWIFMRLNPLLQAVELSRDALLWHRPLNSIHLAYLYGFGIAAFILGSAFFQKLKPTFADVL